MRISKDDPRWKTRYTIRTFRNAEDAAEFAAVRLMNEMRLTDDRIQIFEQTSSSAPYRRITVVKWLL